MFRKHLLWNVALGGWELKTLENHVATASGID